VCVCVCVCERIYIFVCVCVWVGGWVGGWVCVGSSSATCLGLLRNDLHDILDADAKLAISVEAGLCMREILTQ
jgi:hypothetical protein